MTEQDNNGNKDASQGVKANEVAKAIFDNKKKQDIETGKPRDSASKGLVVKFGKGFEIHTEKPLPHLSTPLTKAYYAEHPENPSKKYFAMLSNDILPPRTKSVRSFMNITHKCSPELIGMGTVYWKPEEKQKFVLLFDNIYGRQVVSDLTKKQKPMPELALINRVIVPMTGLLTAMHNASFVHGAIRPTNLYENMLDDGKSFALGQGLSVSISADQPVLFETIERGMAQPSGRGLGTQDDDLYSFGVLLAYLLIGQNPMGNMTDNEIIKSKIEHGSFAAIVANHRLPPGVNEVLRGLLADDHRLRWKIEDLQKWTEGRKSSPKMSIAVAKASRSFEFLNERYISPRLLAISMSQNVSAANKAIEDGTLHKWIERSFSSKEEAERYEDATYNMIRNVKGSELEELLMARVAIALDPEAPIRYKGVSILPSGLGMAITEAVLSQQSIEPYKTIIERQLIPLWAHSQGEKAQYDMSTTLGQIDACKGFLKKNTPGHGFERCIYYLNKEAPCLSPLFKGQYVHDPVSFIYALEDVAAQSQRPKEPFDQHMAAFLSVHFAGANEGDIQLLGAYDLTVRYKAILALLAALQQYAEAPSLPNLSNWMSTMLDPLVKSFHSKSVQKKLKLELETIAKDGNLVAMRETLESRSLHREDEIGFQKAVFEYTKLKRERLQLELELAKDNYGLSQGRDVASTISIILAVMGLGLFLISYFGVF